jgi:hypothetical protein
VRIEEEYKIGKSRDEERKRRTGWGREEEIDEDEKEWKRRRV